jgi:hypothetical protein
MPIPRTRTELTSYVRSTFEKLRAELDADVVKKCQRESYRSIRGRLENGFDRVMTTIDSLDDHELLDVGAFEWAGKYPISRWISINTDRQYTTARTFIRRALREYRK